jgi:hypothetical protein
MVDTIADPPKTEQDANTVNLVPEMSRSAPPLGSLVVPHKTASPIASGDDAMTRHRELGAAAGGRSLEPLKLSRLVVVPGAADQLVGLAHQGALTEALVY